VAGEIGRTPPEGMGSLLKGYREDRGVTQRELAAAVGMSIGALRDLEQGRTRFPRWGIVEELAAVLSLGRAQRDELTQAWRAARTVARRRPRPARRIGGLRIEVLGPLAVWRDGALVALGSVRQRAVLGMLALHPETGLHRDAIIDLLWGEQPPASAVPEVQAYVSRLRTILGGRTGNDWPITTVGGCRYHLALRTGGLQLDLSAFQQAARDARAARADPVHACDLYGQALAMWRGDILSDIDLVRGHPAVVAVACQRAEAVLGYAEAAVLAGIPGHVLPYLRGLCAEEPFDERAHAQLMILLAATGQQAAALQVFTALREVLAREFGLDPSPVLTRAQDLVLQQRISSTQGPAGASLHCPPGLPHGQAVADSALLAVNRTG
jgi:DNA-binding SARP family transcriptional activator/DNA-binding XRE family transcriptional regulator